MPRVVDVEQRRAELADAAARVIARSGLEAATMREVAAEAGWTTGAVTHYFADKHELLLTTFLSSLSQRRAARPGGDDLPARSRLAGSLDRVLPTDDDRRRHWLVTLAFTTQASGDDQLSAAQRDAYRDYRNTVADLAVEAQLATRDTARDLAERLIAVADGVAIQALFDPVSWPPGRQRDALRALLGDLGVDLDAP